jgi:NAD(P)-dependent dehydrogenase (short-subunit alcohol dehydrogenase family)
LIERVCFHIHHEIEEPGWCASHTGQGPKVITMNIRGKVAVVTGAAGGIGLAVATEIARRGAEAVALVDHSEQVEQVALSLNQRFDRPVTVPMVGDVTDDAFRQSVFDLITARHGTPRICVPAAAGALDQAAVKVDAQTGCAVIYPVESFRQSLEVHLVAPVYWALETIARLAEQRRRLGLGCWEPGEGIQGTVTFIGSAATHGGVGPIAYATAKAGLEGVEATLARELLVHGVQCAVVHPDFTRTPLVRALGDEFIKRNVIPFLQSSRLNQPGEVANAVCESIEAAGQSAPPVAASAVPWPDLGWRLPV